VSRRRAYLGGVLAGLTTLLAGCSGTDDSEAPTTTDASTTSETPTETDDGGPPLPPGASLDGDDTPTPDAG